MSPSKKWREEKTIRELEAKRVVKGEIQQSKTNMQAWGLYKYPTPTRRIKSLSMLKSKLKEFFDSKYVDEYTAAYDLPTVTELAVFLGYPSQRALYAEINNPKEIEYSLYLERAVDLINDIASRKQMQIAEAGKKWDGIADVLDRRERIADKTDPTLQTGKNNVNINVSIAVEKTKKIMNDALERFLISTNAQSIEEADTEEIEEVEEQME